LSERASSFSTPLPHGSSSLFYLRILVPPISSSRLGLPTGMFLLMRDFNHAPRRATFPFIAASDTSFQRSLEVPTPSRVEFCLSLFPFNSPSHPSKHTLLLRLNLRLSVQISLKSSLSCTLHSHSHDEFWRASPFCMLSKSQSTSIPPNISHGSRCSP